MALKETTNKLNELLEGVQKDLEKGQRGNKAASQRVRVATIELAKLAKVYRKESIASEKRKKPVKASATKRKPSTPAKKPSTKKAPKKAPARKKTKR